MLFHVTMTHTADDCPAYHSELVPEFIALWRSWMSWARR